VIRAIFPASFDPITNGHLDVATRASHLFDELIVAVFDKPAKNVLFSLEERVAMARSSTAHLPNVRVEGYSGLTVHYARRVEATVIVRGLRAASDFEGEFQLGHANRELAPEIETVCLMGAVQWTFLSSSIIKEIARLGGDVAGLVPPPVLPHLVARSRA
jgi:pantetheine-phosphate adenylyltransferase